MTNSSSGEFLAQVEEILARLAERQEADTKASSERLTALEQLTQSNSRAIQAMADQMAEERLDAAEHRSQTEAERQELREAILRVTQLTEGIANLTVSLDDDRPTVLGRLSRIENKVDRLLERRESGDQPI